MISAIAFVILMLSLGLILFQQRQDEKRGEAFVFDLVGHKITLELLAKHDVRIMEVCEEYVVLSAHNQNFRCEINQDDATWRVVEWER